MTDRSFRFGVVASPRGDATGWRDAARRFEGLGYDTLLTPDTLSTASPFQALAAAAASTTTLRLGTWVLAAPLRTPSEVVREASTLQELSGGRFELGIGAGRPGGETDAHTLGREWGRPGVRVDRVAQTVAAVLGAVDPAPPILIAGGGDRMLRLAGRHATALALPVPPTATLAQIAELAGRAHAAGPGLELALQITGVGDDVPVWLRRQGLAPETLQDAAAMLPGDPPEAAAALQSIRAATGISYITVPGELAAAMGSVVGELSGR